MTAPHRNRKSVAVLGVPFDNLTIREALDAMEKQIEERGFHQVATANVDFVVHAMRDPELQDVLCSCDLIVPDGMPIVWASRLLGTGLKERVSGIDLIPGLAELAARRRYGLYLLGASEDSSRRATEVLQVRFPSLRIVGRDCPPNTPLTEMDHEAILRRIEMAEPDVLLVAMGHPKQEQWLAMHRHRLKVPLCMGVGASLDFLAGAVARAPVWMQRNGLEWLYRTLQEPRRLSRRYLTDAVGLARHLPAQLLAFVMQPRRPLASVLDQRQQGNATVVSVVGDLHTGLLLELEATLSQAVEEGSHLVFDMTAAGYLGLDTVACLVHSARAMRRKGLQFWLAAIPAHTARVFGAAGMKHRFSTASSVADALYRVRKTEIRNLTRSSAMQQINTWPCDLHVQVELLRDSCSHIVFLSQKRFVPRQHEIELRDPLNRHLMIRLTSNS